VVARIRPRYAAPVIPFARASCAIVLLLALIVACEGEGAPALAQAGEHCAHCGMTIAEGSGFTAGATDAAGHAVFFDSPKCLFRWLGQTGGAGATGAWVTEYFTRARTSIDDALYVLGSDVSGPMGRDLVPVTPRERADHFASSHGGRVLSRAEVTPEVVEGLFGR
jgi:copper chaperone NosL